MKTLTYLAIMLKLPQVTLIGIDTRPEGLERAAKICQKGITFGDVKIITDGRFTRSKDPKQIKEDYSRFCFLEMAKYVKTSHALVFQSDGYVQNPNAWEDSWLQYDYIGATWNFKDGLNNGNGGFSLRSKKLLDILARVELDNYHPEDCVISRKIRQWLEKRFNIKFAPEEVCNKFSIEAYGCMNLIDMDGFRANTYTGQFGFHGYSVIGLPIPPSDRELVKFGRQYVKSR